MIPALLLAAAATIAPAPAYKPTGEWSVPITIGTMQHLDFTFGMGGQYKWLKSGMSLGVQATSARLDSFSGSVRGRGGYDRWPPVTLNWRRPSETVYGIAVTLTVPVK